MQLDMADYIRRFALPVSLMLGLFTGLVGAGSWETVLQHINASPFGATDPIFNRDISFYFFNLPFIKALVGLGFWLLGASLIGAAVSYALRGGLSSGAVQYSFGGGNVLESLRIEKPAKIHLSILIVPLFLLTAFDIYAVRIPSLLYNSTGPFTGASFTDINAVLPFLKILIVVAESRGICKVLAENSLTSSISEARRLIQQAAVSVDGEKIQDIKYELSGNRDYLIKVGKKRFLKILSN